jgi:hypothetical protein
LNTRIPHHAPSSLFLVSKRIWRLLVISYVLIAFVYALIFFWIDEVRYEALLASLFFLGILLVLLRAGGVGLGSRLVRYSEHPIHFTLTFLVYFVGAVVFFVLALP